MKTVWTKRFILGVVESHGVEITQEMESSVALAIEKLSNDPIPQRTLLRFMNHCDNSKIHGILSRFMVCPASFSVFDAVQTQEKPRDEA